MKCNLFVAAVAAGVMLVSAVSSADTFPDAYLRGSLGYSKLPIINYSTTNLPPSALVGAGTYNISSKNGYDVGLAFGAQFDNGWRAEGAFDYIHNIAKTLTAHNTFGSPGSNTIQDVGVTKATTYMLNGLYDFDFQAVSLTPYLGLGVGVVSVIHDLQLNFGSGNTEEFCYPAITFAGQGIVGVSYVWSDQVKLSLDYRYLHSAKNKLPSTFGMFAGTTANHYAAHRFSIGLTTSI